MIGETLGQKYRLLRLLGRGGMGAVYEAEVAGSGERVAVKVLHGHLVVPGGEGPRRFRREAAAVRAVRGDHIIHVLDAAADEHTGQLYLVTELLDGEDLQKMLDRVGPLAEAGAVGVAAQALRGLMEAHAAGVIHRDIKPANLFLSKRPDGALVVKLLDFGIAKLDIPLAAAPTADLAGVDLTTTGSFLGSPLYMSPEQVQSSRDVDARSDVWSLGCVLYAALAGRAPHQHLTSIGQLLVAICVSPAPPLREVAPWVPADLCEVVHRALEIRPEARYPSAAAMLEALRRFGTSDTLVDEMLASSGQSPRVAAYPSAPPSPLVGSPRVIVAPAANTDVRGDGPTQGARPTAPPSTAVYSPRPFPLHHPRLRA
ncbi:MAG: serine/threonine-protein kinase [Polyangiaceae bacterium]